MVDIIGCGLAGSEASLYLANHGVKVRLFEMKPKSKSPAHKSSKFGEIVCSNSFKSDDLISASGVLKSELRKLGSSLIEIADMTRVPAGNALAVDRELFASSVTERIKSNSNIEIICKECEDWDTEAYTIIATGPLTTDKLSGAINKKLGDYLYFFDAVAPIVTGDSVDMDKAFFASRYDKGTSDYINCAFNQSEYDAFYEELVKAEGVIVEEWDKIPVYENCMPIEIMAKRGKDTIRFGPLKPVGIIDPKSGERPYAVVQLRKENVLGDMYNLVGFQTNLKFAEQKRVFRMIPALKNAEFVRYGVMHRNNFVNAPQVLTSSFATKKYPKTYLAGQISGVEGYVESIASGLLTAINILKDMNGEDAFILPNTTVLGGLTRYLATENAFFQPMNANFGILPPLEVRERNKQKKKQAYSDRAVAEMDAFLQRLR